MKNQLMKADKSGMHGVDSNYDIIGRMGVLGDKVIQSLYQHRRRFQVGVGGST